jgi:hypothetical protein
MEQIPFFAAKMLYRAASSALLRRLKSPETGGRNERGVTRESCPGNISRSEFAAAARRCRGAKTGEEVSARTFRERLSRKRSPFFRFLMIRAARQHRIGWQAVICAESRRFLKGGDGRERSV